MPVTQLYPIHGQLRPGTNRYARAGWGYGGYNGAFGQVTPTNAAVDVSQAFSAEAAGELAAGIAALAAGEPRIGQQRIQAANSLQRQAAGLEAEQQAGPPGLEHARARARTELPPTASPKAVEARAAALARGAKGGFMGRGIPWEGKTGAEKAATVGVAGGGGLGVAWMLGLL